MPNCLTCGATITEEQNMKFHGNCPECVRMAPINKVARHEDTMNQCVPFICIGSVILVLIFAFSSGLF